MKAYIYIIDQQCLSQIMVVKKPTPITKKSKFCQIGPGEPKLAAKKNGSHVKNVRVLCSQAW